MVLSIVYLPGFDQEEDQYGQNRLLDWNITVAENQTMEVFLNFSQPLLISTGQFPCELQLKFENSTDLDDQKALGFTSINYGTEVQKYKINKFLPRMRKEDDIYLIIVEETANALLVMIEVLAISSPFLKFLFGMATSQLWSMVEGMQLIVNYPMLQINAPINTGIVQALFRKIATFEVIDGDWLKELLWHYDQEDDKTDFFFQAAGTEDLLFMFSFGLPLYVYWCNVSMLCILQLTTSVATCCAKAKDVNEGGELQQICASKFTQFYYKAKSKSISTLEELKWNVFALFYYETTLELGISIMLNISKPIEDVYDKWGIGFTYFFLITQVLFFVLSAWLFCKTERLNKYQVNFGTIYEKFNYENPATRIMYAFFILKRLIFVYIVFYVKIECVAIIAFVFLVKAILVLQIKPYVNRKIYKAEIFNELINVLFFITIQAFKGPYIDPKNQNKVGWFSAAIMIYFVMHHLMSYCIGSIQSIIYYFKIKRLKKQQIQAIEFRAKNKKELERVAEHLKLNKEIEAVILKNQQEAKLANERKLQRQNLLRSYSSLSLSQVQEEADSDSDMDIDLPQHKDVKLLPQRVDESHKLKNHISEQIQSIRVFRPGLGSIQGISTKKNLKQLDNEQHRVKFPSINESDMQLMYSEQQEDLEGQKEEVPVETVNELVNISYDDEQDKPMYQSRYAYIEENVASLDKQTLDSFPKKYDQDTLKSLNMQTNGIRQKAEATIGSKKLNKNQKQRFQQLIKAHEEAERSKFK